MPCADSTGHTPQSPPAPPPRRSFYRSAGELELAQLFASTLLKYYIRRRRKNREVWTEPSLAPSNIRPSNIRQDMSLKVVSTTGWNPLLALQSQAADLTA